MKYKAAALFMLFILLFSFSFVHGSEEYRVDIVSVLVLEGNNGVVYGLYVCSHSYRIVVYNDNVTIYSPYYFEKLYPLAINYNTNSSTLNNITLHSPYHGTFLDCGGTFFVYKDYTLTPNEVKHRSEEVPCEMYEGVTAVTTFGCIAGVMGLTISIANETFTITQNITLLNFTTTLDKTKIEYAEITVLKIDYSGAYDKPHVEVEKWKKKYNEICDMFLDIREKYMYYRNLYEQLQSDYEDLQQKYNQLQDQYGELQINYEQIQEEYNQIQQKYSQDLNVAQQQISSLEKTLNDKGKELAEAKKLNNIMWIIIAILAITNVATIIFKKPS